MKNDIASRASQRLMEPLVIVSMIWHWSCVLLDMRNKNIVVGNLGRIAAGIVAAVLWTGGVSYGAGGPGGETPAGGGGAVKGGGVTNGGGQSGQSANNEHPAAGAGGGQPINAGGNTAPAAVKPAAPAAHSEPAGNGGQTVGDKSATASKANPNNPNASPANQQGSAADHNRDRRNNFYNEGEIYGNPWSPYAYGWYGEEYPYGATYSEPVYTNPSNTTPANNNNNAAPAASNSPAPASAVPNPAQVTNAVDKSPAMMAANEEVRAEQAVYDGERERVLHGLKDKPEYQQAMARKQAASAKVDAVKTDVTPATGTPAPALTKAATVKMDASSEVTKMEEEAIAGDASAAAAKLKLNQAIANRDALRAKLLAEH